MGNLLNLVVGIMGVLLLRIWFDWTPVHWKWWAVMVPWCLLGAFIIVYILKI